MSLKRFLLLDFDGTLAKITGHPKDATLDPQMRALLKKLAKRKDTQIAIVSGRALADVKKRVGLPHLTYVGNHGLEIQNGRKAFVYPDAKRMVKPMAAISHELSRLERFPGIHLEKKGLTLSLHYRQAGAKIRRLVKPQVREMLRPFVKQHGIQLRPGKQCIEIRPNLPWDKGKAVLWLLKHRAAKTALLPIYVGDDHTDEDAFRAVKQLKPKGIAIRVGRKRNSEADHFLPNVHAVKTFLTWLEKESP